jgi:hypothetical protein
MSLQGRSMCPLSHGLLTLCLGLGCRMHSCDTAYYLLFKAACDAESDFGANTPLPLSLSLPPSLPPSLSLSLSRFLFLSFAFSLALSRSLALSAQVCGSDKHIETEELSVVSLG